MPLIRPSRDEDIPAITAIYGHHVLHGTGTFETEPPSVADMTARRADVLSKGLPYLVAEQDGKIAGFAYGNWFKPRPAYRFSVEDSIYLRPTSTARAWARPAGRTAGAAEAVGIRKAMAVIGDSANAGSVGVHRSLGFTEVGTIRPAAGNSAPGATSSSWKSPWAQATRNHRPGSPPHNRRMQTAAASSPKAPKNKTLAAWLAFITGQLGVHRLYLFGLGDVWAWLHPIAAALGWWGVERVRLYGQDDHLAWVLIPLLGFTLAGTALTAIYYGLMRRKNGMRCTTPARRPPRPATPTG
jgi:L-amino acid N-acyltransferase YncA